MATIEQSSSGGITEKRRIFQQYKQDVKERGKPFFPYAVFHDSVMALVVVATIVVLARRIADPIPPDPERPFDALGAVLSAVGMFFLVFGILQADNDPALMALFLALGAAFLALELREFANMIADGATPQRSAFLSAFFTLVGCHGLHVTAGLVWLAVMMAQVAIKGFRANIERRLLCFSLFWHTLDIVWVWLFTVVYLMGTLP